MATEKDHSAKPTTEKESGKKKDNTLKIVLIVVGVFVGLGILASIAGTILVATVFKSATKNIKVDSDGNGGQVTFQSDDGQKTATYGEGATLPDDFPKDVPMYQPSTLVYATSSDGKRFAASLKTDDSAKQITDFYKQKLAEEGWKLSNSGSYDTTTSLLFKKGDRRASVTAYTSSDDGAQKTVATIAITPGTY